MKNRRTAGFTLIELMVVVAVVAILAAIAFPSYQDYIRKSRRSEAISALQDVHLRQERWRVDHAQYATTAQLGTMPVANQYTVTVTANSATGYTLSAAPNTSNQQKDSCGTLTLSSDKGVISKASSTGSGCW